MKRKVLALAVLLSATGAQFASASDGTINFNGLLTAATCAITVNDVPTPAVATVTLPTVSTSVLAATGQVAGATDFNIKLSGCSPSSGAVAAYFEAGSGVDPLTGNVKNSSGTATNVQFQLLDATNGDAIAAGNTNQRTLTTHIMRDMGSATLPYAVQYIAQDATTAGTVVGSVTYSIDYQ